MPGQINQTPPWIIPVITAFLGYFVAILIERFKNRKVILKWKREILPLAKATQHSVWGNIEVRHNNRLTNQLSFVTYEVRNDSNIDLENVNVNFWCDSESQFLNYQANYIQSGDLIKHESEYAKEFDEVIRLNKEYENSLKFNPDLLMSEELKGKLIYILSNVQFTLPVLNRQTSVRFRFLAENFKGDIPQISMSPLHKSCDVAIEENDSERKNKENRYAGLIWLILLITSVSIIYFKYQTSVAVIWTGVLSLITLYLSIGIYRVLILIKKLCR